MDVLFWIKIVLMVFGAAAALAALLYLPKLRYFCFCFQKPEHRRATRKRKISLVIAARDESATIGDLLESIRIQDYDSDYFDVNIIVKDVNDPTIGIAKTAGANVFIVPEQSCKGDALDGYFHAISEEKRNSYAAFAIIDADAILSHDYLSELNNALEYPCQIFTTRKNIKNFLGTRKARSLICDCSALTYPVLDEMGNNYRMKKGIPLNFCGQGLLVRSEVIKELGGWPYRTLTEDYEMKMDSVLRGFTSMYYPYAVLYTEEVIKHGESWARRLRWVMGFTQCDLKYKKQIRKKIKEEGAPFALRYDLFFSIVPLVLFITAALLTALFGVGFGIYCAIVGDRLWLTSLLLLAVMPLASMYVLEWFYCFLTYLSYRDAFDGVPFAERIITLMLAPFFMFEFFPLFMHAQLSLLTKRNMNWHKTQRVKFTRRARMKTAIKRRKRKAENVTASQEEQQTESIK